MLTDRQRIELLLFPQMLLAMLIAGVEDAKKGADQYLGAQTQLVEACRDALHGCDDRKRAKLLRRVDRVHLEVIDPYLKDGVLMAKIGLMALYALQAVLDCDYLVLTEGSALSKALDHLLPALEHEMGGKLEASARKQAGKMICHLQTLGYFESVPTERIAA